MGEEGTRGRERDGLDTCKKNGGEVSAGEANDLLLRIGRGGRRTERRAKVVAMC